ncbi:MAG: HelD family protein, partial [Micromonosporaceae bacterium]
QIAQYDAVEENLCFGRLDFHEEEHRHIGRIGIFDETADYRPLLLDWRAPAARPFYVSTAASPDGVRRRRHIHTRGREVTHVDDEALDLNTVDPDRPDAFGLIGEASLLAALNANRTGRMTDIVQTIQAEQDEVIRSPLQGVLVVQGGPGTGKTAVALHRAAYLLYTYREQLSKRGVLVVGPNATFLRYVSQVLPSLAETGVLLQTVGELYPSVSAELSESPAAAEVKGRAEMAKVLAAAVRDRQRAPDHVLEIRAEVGLSVETLRLDRRMVEKARTRARRSRKPHNLARAIFRREMIKALTRQLTQRLGADPYHGNDSQDGARPDHGEPEGMGGSGGDGSAQRGAGFAGRRNLLSADDVSDLREEIRESPEVREALDSLWPLLTPQQLLADLYGSDERIAAATPGWSAEERALLRQEPVPDDASATSQAAGWTAADVPLLDEAAELLGEDDSVTRAQQELERRRRIGYAEGVLELMAGSRSFDFEDEEAEVLVAMDLIGAEQLAQRQEERDYRTTAERAAADRTWAYGHVIVDEAQELSPMAWRLLMRRCPSRSMTIVGDVAQTGALAGVGKWASVLDSYAPDRWRLGELTVSYRTPAEIMDVASEVLAVIDPAGTPPRAVRSTGAPPRRLRVGPADFGAELAREAAALAAAVGQGRVGVIVPASRAEELSSLVKAQIPDAAVGENPELLSQVTVLTVRQTKGLEFDSVLVADPDRITADSPRGHNDLYVALTRATQRLTILEAGADLEPAR